MCGIAFAAGLSALCDTHACLRPGQAPILWAYWMRAVALLGCTAGVLALQGMAAAPHTCKSANSVTSCDPRTCDPVSADTPAHPAAASHVQPPTMPGAQVASTVALLMFGAVGAWLGGAKRIRAALRVLIGGWLAMMITFGTGRLFGEDPA